MGRTRTGGRYGTREHLGQVIDDPLDGGADHEWKRVLSEIEAVFDERLG